MNSWELHTNVLKLYRNHKQSTGCTINFHGGAITSWKVLNMEQLFVWDDSKFDNINPVRGGIHVLFPNFNMDRINMPNNGFARFCKWEKRKDPYVLNNNIAVEVDLNENVIMKALRWNHPFNLNLNIILGFTTLTSIVAVYNPSPEKTISFHLALEALLRLRSIEHCQIHGLNDCEYIDKVNCRTDVDRQTPLVVTEKTDRIYRKAKDEINIFDLAESRTIKLTKLNFPDISLVNPWIGESNQMLCVAPGFLSHAVEVSPKSWYNAGLRLEVIQDQQMILM